MRILIFLWFFLFLFSNADGQILKINKGDLSSDTSNVFLGSVDLNLNVNNQSATPEENLVYTGLEIGNDLIYLSENHAYLLLNNLKYFRISNGPLISTGHAHARVNLKRKEALSYEMFTQVQYDDGRRMPLRFLIGNGMRVRIVKGDKGNLYGGIGIMNELEWWKPFNSEDVIKKQIWKNTTYLSGNVLIAENFKIDLITYYQGGWDDESELVRHRVSGDLSLNTKITGRLAFTTNFTLLYDAHPVININPLVYSLTNGLKFNF